MCEDAELSAILAAFFPVIVKYVTATLTFLALHITFVSLPDPPKQ